MNVIVLGIQLWLLFVTFTPHTLIQVGICLIADTSRWPNFMTDFTLLMNPLFAFHETSSLLSQPVAAHGFCVWEITNNLHEGIVLCIATVGYDFYGSFAGQKVFAS